MSPALLTAANLDRARSGLPAATRHLNLRADVSAEASSIVRRYRTTVAQILESIA
jgi:hypothetical protein